MSTTEIQKREDSPKATIEKYITSAMPKLSKLLPTHLKPDMFLRKVIFAVNKNPDLMKCEPMTILSAIGEAASLGLDPTGGVLGEAHLVPFNVKGKDGKFRMVCNMVPGWQGLQSLARRTGGVVFDAPVAVFKGDHIEVKRGSEPVLIHEPDIFGANYGDPDQLIAAYTCATLEGQKLWDIMSRREIDRVRSMSKSKSDYGPWSVHYVEMAKKTSVKRFCKSLPKSGEFARALALEDNAESAADEGRAFASEHVIDVLGIPPEEPAPTRTESAKDAIAAKAQAANAAPKRDETEDERNLRLAQEDAERAGR